MNSIEETSDSIFLTSLDNDESSDMDIIPLLNHHHSHILDHNNDVKHYCNNNKNNNNNNNNNNSNTNNHVSMNRNNDYNKTKHLEINDNNNKDIEHKVLLYPCRQRDFSHDLYYKSTQIAKSKILGAFVMCCIFTIVEFLGGYIAGSLAIMSDAAHLASDCISFVISLLAIWLGNRPPDDKMSFGYKRIEVVGALVSILAIWTLTAILVFAAAQRLYNQDFTLDSNTMLIVSAVGIIINIVMIFILHTPNCILLPNRQRLHLSSHNHSHSHSHNHSHSYSYNPNQNQDTNHNHRNHNNNNHTLRSKTNYTKNTESAMANNSIVNRDDEDESGARQLLLNETILNSLNENTFKSHETDEHTTNNINLRAALIHVIGDLVQSFGVFLASVLIKCYPKAVFLDPICTIIFSIIVILTTVNLFRESFCVLINSVPQKFPLSDLKTELLQLDGVKSIHHLNVWMNATNFEILTVHLVIDSQANYAAILQEARSLVQNSKYNIKQCTIQIES